MATYDDAATAAGKGSAGNLYLSAANLVGPLWAGVATGTANYIILTPANPVLSLVTGMTFIFKASANQTGACEIAISGLEAEAIQLKGSALSSGQIDANGLYLVTWTGSVFDLLAVS